MSTQDTKDRLLDAAERLFGARGFEGASLRSVTAEAGVNLAAVHYHFGSKEALLRAVAARRIEPLNRERLSLLDRIEAHEPSSPQVLESILDAFFRPVLHMEPSSAEESSRLRRLAAVLYSEPAEFVQPLVADFFGEVGRRFGQALSRVLPDLSPEEVALRLQFSVGVLVHVISGHLANRVYLERPSLRSDDQGLLQAMIAFTAAGLRAPASLGGRKQRRGGA